MLVIFLVLVRFALRWFPGFLDRRAGRGAFVAGLLTVRLHGIS